MNRRAFISGLLATTALSVVPAAMASTHVNPALANAASAWYLEVQASMFHILKKSYVEIPSQWDEIFSAEWSTGDLKYPPMRVPRPDGWRDWYGTEGL